jgi:hypothetical protein
MKSRGAQIEVGRRFSRRTIVQEADGPHSEFQKIEWDDVWCASTIAHHARHARRVLESDGIDVKGMLADSPHGSRVRDYVLNYLEREPDSRVGLAARILELSLHILALMDMRGDGRVIPGYAHRLSRLTLLARVYEADADHQREAGKGRGHQQRKEREKRRRDAGLDKKGIVAKFTADLARMRDEMGDFLSARALWPLLFSELDRDCSPVMVDDDKGNPLRIDYLRGDKAKTITFASFKVMVTEARKVK